MHIFDGLASKVLDVSITVFVPIIGALVSAVLARQLQKLGVTLTDAQDAQLKRGVTEAIQSVEEKARRGDISQGDKHAAAIQIVQANNPNVTAGEVSQKIDATLPEVRAKLEPVPSAAPATVGR
jgi:3-hydroxyacyl-CoA dehydrogenase